AARPDRRHRVRRRRTTRRLSCRGRPQLLEITHFPTVIRMEYRLQARSSGGTLCRRTSRTSPPPGGPMRAATIQSPAPQRSMGGSPHRGFTLVELLVVIGIITLLIGILFPVLGRAREYARTIQCASNIKQICNAVLMYVNDNRGILPFTSALPESMLSPETLRAYPVRLQEFGRLNFNEGTFWPYLSASPAVREQIYSCPSDEPPRYARQYLLPKPNLNFPRNFSYTFHGDIGGWARKIPPQSFKDWAGLKITMVKHPSHKVMILEEEMPR